MNDGSVSIKKLVKTYVDDRGRPTFTAVKNIDLDIQEGEFMVLVGPSGCGKSTTLRMVAGLEKISDGTIEIGGRVVNDMEPKDRGIAMVFQNYALYPHMTIFNNMAFGLQLAKKNKDFISETVPARLNDDLRYPRPGGSHDDGRPYLRDARRQDHAGR